ncbi:MAG: TadE/TadG family type IV pilus assembly protein [Actinomycetota bacterium]|nr:TadE/TadG family type IV pilus assembly protein [Actinomycetota bacterium]
MNPLDERGAVSSEFAVVMAAFLTTFMLLVVSAGRVAQAENDVRSAAHEAARAASLAGTITQADAEARRVVDANLVTSGLSCADGLDVAVGLDQFQPGGSVSVTVACDASFADLASLDVPGSRRFTSTATEIIDTYRADP